MGATPSWVSARQLCILIKHWARRRRLSNTLQGTPSSYAWVLLAIATMQAGPWPGQDVPGWQMKTYCRGLPCLQKVFVGPQWSVRGFGHTADGHPVEYAFSRAWPLLSQFPERPLALLLRDFFEYAARLGSLGAAPHLGGVPLVASVRNGGIFPAQFPWVVVESQPPFQGAIRSPPGHLFCIEDPIEALRDLGDKVTEETLPLVREEIDRARRILENALGAGPDSGTDRVSAISWHEAVQELFEARED